MTIVLILSISYVDITIFYIRAYIFISSLFIFP